MSKYKPEEIVPGLKVALEIATDSCRGCDRWDFEKEGCGSADCGFKHAHEYLREMIEDPSIRPSALVVGEKKDE